jgi:hypothetical protein
VLRSIFTFLAFALSAAAFQGCARPRLPGPPVPEQLPAAPEGMAPEAWLQGHAAFERVRKAGLSARPLLAIIDYSRPASEPRLWVIDVTTDDILTRDFVAHGWASGGLWATDFSNRNGSNQSSLGVFLTGEAYHGIRGLSLRLLGLEPGINDRARSRGIVIHGSPSVNAFRAARGGQGRTEGCPAVPMASAKQLVSLLEGGAVVFAWYPDPFFLSHSSYLERFSRPHSAGL